MARPTQVASTQGQWACSVCPPSMTQRDSAGISARPLLIRLANRGTTAMKMISTAATPASTSTLGYTSALRNCCCTWRSCSSWREALSRASAMRPAASPASTRLRRAPAGRRRPGAGPGRVAGRCAPRAPAAPAARRARCRHRPVPATAPLRTSPHQRRAGCPVPAAARCALLHRPGPLHVEALGPSARSGRRPPGAGRAEFRAPRRRPRPPAPR